MGKGWSREIRRRGREGEREGEREEGRERKSENVAKLSLMRSSWEDGIAKKMVESLCLLRLRDGLHQKVAGQRWLLCDGRFVIISIQNVRSVILKCKCLNWRGEGPNWTPPILSSFGGDFPAKGSHNRLLPSKMSQIVHSAGPELDVGG